MTNEMYVMAAAIGGFIVQELRSINKGIKGNPDSPSSFSFVYYFSRLRNLIQLAINSIGSAVLFLGRHEVGNFAASLPLVSGLGDATPVLVGGAIGFGGPWVVRKAGDLLDKDTPKPEGE